MKHYCPKCGKEVVVYQEEIETSHDCIINLHAHADVTFPTDELSMDAGRRLSPILGGFTSLTYDYETVDDAIRDTMQYDFLCPHCGEILDENFMAKLVVEEAEDADSEEDKEKS